MLHQALVSAAVVVGMVAMIAAGHWFQYRLSKGRMYSPLWLAFSAVFVFLVLIVRYLRN